MKFNNLYWQVLETDKATYYLYEAYLDVRVANNPLVRIIGMAKQWDKDSFYCHFWFEEYSVTSKATTFESISKVEYFKSDMLWTIMLSCEIPSEYENMVPDSVSLSSTSCGNLSNNMR